MVRNTQQEFDGDAGGFHLRDDVNSEACHNNDGHEITHKRMGKAISEKIRNGKFAKVAQWFRHQNRRKWKTEHRAGK
jgi:hypothetical protein